MFDYNCPDCNEAKLQSDKNARKINEVIDQVNQIIDNDIATIEYLLEKADEIVGEVAEKKVSEEMSDILTHFTGGNAMQEHSHVNKSILDKFSEVDNKLLYDGKPIESSNSGSSGGTTSTDFDTDISLPFKALSNTEVQLTFSPNEIETYDLEIGDLNTVDGWTVTCSVENTFEPVEYKGKKCIHFSKDPSTVQYATIS